MTQPGPQLLLVGVALLCFALCSPSSVQAQQTPSQARAHPESDSAIEKRSLVYGDQQMAVTANPHATRAAVAMLNKGGSATDAAIAAQMVLNLVEPQSSGIGGGAFMLTYEARSQRVRVFDGREIAPASASPDQFLLDGAKRMKFFDAVDSGLSVGVPGLLRMLDLAHRAQGRLAWAQLFEPAIALAQSGFEISPRLFKSVQSRLKRIQAQPVAAAYFLTKAGEPKPVGTVLRNPQFAATLRSIADKGADAFYSGDNAKAIVQAVNNRSERPGQMTVADLQGYRALEREPLCAMYRKLRVCGMPPPSSGALTVLQTLGLLEQFDLSELAPDSAQAIHLMSEAYRLAYADRARYIADPGFVTVPVTGLLSDPYRRARAQLIDRKRSMGKPQPGSPPGAPRAGTDQSVELAGTTHLSIVDKNGDAVSMTSSIETAFGSMLMVGGYLLNNQLTDFSFHPIDRQGVPIANSVAPGKRPRSSMAPTVVLDDQGRLEALLGSPGGSSIIQYVTRTLVAMIDWRLDVQQAISAAHFGAKTSKTTTLEAGTTAANAADALTALGHKVRTRALTSGIHAIVFNGKREDGKPGALAVGQRRSGWAAGADPRREGLALSGE